MRASDVTRLLSSKRSRRVAPEDEKYPCLTLDAQALTRALVTKHETTPNLNEAQGVPSHLIRQPTQSVPRSVLDLTCIKLETSDSEYRVAMPCDDMQEADQRRQRIYALNNVMSTRGRQAWMTYLASRRRQMRLLECCLDVAGQRLLLWAFQRFLERCKLVQQDEEAKEAEARAASFARCLCQAAGLPQDEPMLKAMPLDTTSSEDVRRFCPWNQTRHGCPLLSTAGACPLSHNLLPGGHVTWAFRRWAQEKHGGWIGQRPKIG